MAFGGGFVKNENDGYLGKKLGLEKPKIQFPETPIKAQNPYYDAIFLYRARLAGQPVENPQVNFRAIDVALPYLPRPSAWLVCNQASDLID